jgi:hypothetical protein
VGSVAARPRIGGLSTRVDQDGFPVLPPTLLTIHRTCGRDEQTRQIICALDGRRFGQVLFGQRLTIEVVPGPHMLRIHNTLVWKTSCFDAEPGGHVHYTVWNRGWGELYYLMIVFVGAAPLGVGLAPGTPDEVETRWATARRR